MTKQIPPVPSSRRQSRGLSLLELLVASVLIATVAVSLTTVMVTSMANNKRGDDFSRATNHGRTLYERFVGTPIDHPSLDVTAGEVDDDSRGQTVVGRNAQVIQYTYYDPVEVTATTLPTGVPNDGPVLGDGQWLLDDDLPADADEDGGANTLYETRVEYRWYSYGDIIQGQVSTVDGRTLIQGGHPDLFDDPLDPYDPDTLEGLPYRHFQEITVLVGCRGCDLADLTAEGEADELVGTGPTSGARQSYQIQHMRGF
ncbi:MAG: prepilin-type N-terminal cleavage/methylation domain-containing protein [Acidobacteriota bacterium]